MTNDEHDENLWRDNLDRANGRVTKQRHDYDYRKHWSEQPATPMKSQYEEWTKNRDAPNPTSKPAPNNWPPKRIFAVALCVGFFGLIVAGAAANHAEPAPQRPKITQTDSRPGPALLLTVAILDALFGESRASIDARQLKDACHANGGIYMGGVNGGDNWCDLRK